MLGEATLDVSGTFAGEAIRLLILFAAPHNRSVQRARALGNNTLGQGRSLEQSEVIESDSKI